MKSFIPYHKPFLGREEAAAASKVVLSGAVMARELEAKNVNWAVLSDDALDGREDLRFHNTYSFLWRYFGDRFEPVASRELPEGWVLLRRKR